LNEVDVEKLYKIFVSIKECKKDKSGKKYVYPGFEEFPCVQCEKEAKHATDIARFEADLAKYRELGLITNYDFIMRVKAEFGTSQSLPLTSLQNSAESSVLGMTEPDVRMALGKIESDIKAGVSPGCLFVIYNPIRKQTTEGVISKIEFEEVWNEILGPHLKASSSSDSSAAPTLHDFFASVPDEMKVKVPGRHGYVNSCDTDSDNADPDDDDHGDEDEGKRKKPGKKGNGKRRKGGKKRISSDEEHKEKNKGRTHSRIAV
jgi:hypothetical protein